MISVKLYLYKHIAMYFVRESWFSLLVLYSGRCNLYWNKRPFWRVHICYLIPIRYSIGFIKNFEVEVKDHWVLVVGWATFSLSWKSQKLWKKCSCCKTNYWLICNLKKKTEKICSDLISPINWTIGADEKFWIKIGGQPFMQFLRQRDDPWSRRLHGAMFCKLRHASSNPLVKIKHKVRQGQLSKFWVTY